MVYVINFCRQLLQKQRKRLLATGYTEKEKNLLLQQDIED
jgi:hypothetical protein